MSSQPASAYRRDTDRDELSFVAGWSAIDETAIEKLTSIGLELMGKSALPMGWFENDARTCRRTRGW